MHEEYVNLWNEIETENNEQLNEEVASEVDKQNSNDRLNPESTSNANHVLRERSNLNYKLRKNIKPPNRYDDETSYSAIIDEPLTYQDAIKFNESEGWLASKDDESERIE